MSIALRPAAGAPAAEALPGWTRLSDSPLWPSQRRYFCQAGISAWRDNVVPSFVTSNSFIARAYVELALAWRRDAAGEPLTIVELGAGSGRFAHFFLRHAAAAGMDARALRYVMTDVSRANLEFWRGHAKFASFVASGMLDFALFDPVRDASLRLEISGVALGGSTPAGPTLAIANYVFDGIEQDAFQVSHGALHECLVSVDGIDDSADDLDNAELTYAQRPCDAGPYDDAAWNAVLAAYRDGLANGAFLLPVGAFRVIDNLRRLAGAPLLLLAGDKGMTRMEAWTGMAPLRVVRHGSVSLPVNFHALAEFTQARGGAVLDPATAAASLNIFGFALDVPGDRLVATRQAFEQAIVRHGPDDLYQLKKGMEKNHATLSLAQMIALLRATDWDPSVVSGMYDALADVLTDGTPDQQHTISAGVAAAWDRYLPLGEENDFAFQLGVLEALMGHYRLALGFFAASHAAHGAHEAVEENIRLCQKHLEED